VNDEALINSSIAKPVYYRFSFWIHCASALCGYITMILVLFVALALRATPDSAASLSLVAVPAMLAPIAIACSVPATWICLGIASRLKLTRYRELALMGLASSAVTTVCLAVAAAPPEFSLLVEAVLRDGILAGVSVAGRYLGALSIIAGCLAPSGVVAALTYRRLAECEYFWRGELQ
jgi:hypothetical protein